MRKANNSPDWLLAILAEQKRQYEAAHNTLASQVKVRLAEKDAEIAKLRDELARYGQPAASAEPSDDVRGEVALRLQERNRHIDIPTARYYVDEVCALLSRYGRPAGDAEYPQVAEVCIEPDYWSRGHFYEGRRKIIKPVRSLLDLPVGTKLYAAPVAAQAQPVDAAVAAIRFALGADEGIEWLRCWNEGDFDSCRREWPEAPDECFIGADPLHPGTKAALAAQASGQAQDADMYWDADDPERFAATDLHGAVEYMMDGYTESDLPMELDLQCARRMPNIRVRVTAYSESGGYDYEVIDAASAAGGEHGN